VIKVEKLIRKQGLWLILVGVFILSFTSYDVEAAVTAPSFDTLPINDTMITGVGNAGSVQGEDGHKYVQVTGTTQNSRGAVWFNKPLSFSKSFHLEMAFCIDKNGADSDGLAFVLQTNGTTGVVADKAGPTIGVWANPNILSSEPPSEPPSEPHNTGAILNSFAIEFDTFYNDNHTDKSMDHGVEKGSSGHHIAWSYPGSEESYDQTEVSYTEWFVQKKEWQKVLKHNDVVAISDISDGAWHTFTVDYSKEKGELNYQVNGFSNEINVTIPVADTFKEKLGISNDQTPVYFGFTGANGTNAQNKAVSFVNVEGLVDIEMRTGVLRQNESIPFLDTGNPESQTDEIIESTKEVYYVTSIDYKNTSVLPELDTGIKLSYLMPDGLSVENVYFNVYEKGNSTIPSGGDPLSYSQEKGELVVDLPEMTRGNLYTVSFSVSYTGDSVNRNIELTVPVVTTFNGNMYVSSVTTGAAETHFYKIKEILPPTITTDTGKTSIEEIEIADCPTIRQGQDVITEITIDDQNSTVVSIFVSGFFKDFSDMDLSKLTYTQKDPINRTELEVSFFDTLKLETDENLEPGNRYYFAVYVEDYEGNKSDIFYFAFDVKGIVKLVSVPATLAGTSLTLNQLAQSIRSDGYAYVKVPTDEQTGIFKVTNTSDDYSWTLSGQKTALKTEEEQPLAEDIQLELVLYTNEDDKDPAYTIDFSNQEVFAKGTPQDAQDFTLNLNDYVCYIRFKVDVSQVIPGTYTGEVQWQLESTITDP
jgi:hypothetical protein